MAILNEARIHLEKALEIDPEFAKARLALATLHQEEGRRTEAVRLLKETIESRPTLAEARLLLADVLLEEDEVGEAITQLREAANIDPNDHVSRRRLAFLLAAKNETKLAEDLFTRVVELDPFDGEAHLQLAMLLEHPDDFQRASLLFQIAADLMPDNPLPPYHMALLLLRGEHTDEEGKLVTEPCPATARKLLQQTIKLAPDHGPAHLSLGQIFRDEGDLLAARRQFKQAVNDERSAGFAYLELARTEIAADKDHLARQFLDKAVEHPASRDQALCERADLLILNDKVAKAERDLRTAAKNLARTESKLLKESDSAAAKSNFARARRLHEEAFGARHAQGPIWGRLGEIKSSSGKQDEAIQLFERALVADPSLYETRFALALLLEETGSKEESTTQLEAVVEAEWSHAEAHFELGERALKAKDGQRAEMHFLIVTDLVPDHHEAIDRLKLIARR